MTRFISMAGAAAAVFLLSAGVASAESWSRSWTGPNGATGTRTVQCGYHGCGYSAHGSGPAGQSWSRSGAVVHGPYRSYGYRAVTGPAGNTYVTRRAWPRY